MNDGNQPIVIDNGSGVMKAGFSGSNKPRVVFRTCVGRPKHLRVMPGGVFDGLECFVGTKIDDHRGALLLSHPMEHGVVCNWGDMEKLWTHIYSRDNLNCKSEDHAVLLTEAPLNPHHNREKAAELFFEGFSCPAVHFSVQAVLSLYASGRTTGIVMDIGDGVTHCVPVYEGFAMPHAISRIDLGGRDITQYLQLLLRRSGYTFTTSGEMEIVRSIKEKCCTVAPSSTYLQSAPGAANSYTLPDGVEVSLAPGTARAAAEALFRPDLIGSEHLGVHDSLVTSIMKCDIDLRRHLFSQVVLAGGSTLFPGFGERLLHEVRTHTSAPKDTKIRIAAPPERIYSTWIGGSILASLSTFKTMWISKSEYLEQGSRIVCSKF